MPFAEQEGDLRRLLETLPVARLSIDKSGIGMNLAENLARDYPQVIPEAFSNESKERWATDFKILLQRRDILLPRDRELVGQIHSIKRRVLPSGKISFDADKLAENAQMFIDTIVKMKPSGAKGQYVKKVTVSGTMTPGVPVAL